MWTADVRWSGAEASWMVDMYRNGDRVFMRDRKDRPFVRAFLRKSRAERVAFADLEHAQRHDRLPYKARQFTTGAPGWEWAP